MMINSLPEHGFQYPKGSPHPTKNTTASDVALLADVPKRRRAAFAQSRPFWQREKGRCGVTMFLKADNLSKTYSSGFLSGKKVSALQNASITIRDGETVGIFGKSGSGKTTLANLIAGGDSRVIRPDFLGRQAGCIPLSRYTPAGHSDGISAPGGRHLTRAGVWSGV